MRDRPRLSGDESLLAAAERMFAARREPLPDWPHANIRMLFVTLTKVPVTRFVPRHTIRPRPLKRRSRATPSKIHGVEPVRGDAVGPGRQLDVVVKRPFDGQFG